MRSKPPHARFLAVGITAALTIAACGSDDAGSTQSESLTTNVPTSESSSANAPTTDAPTAAASTEETSAVEATPADAGYAYASNVDSHRLVVNDICEVKELLDADTVDYDAINVLYTDGKNSVKSDGYRTIGGFASSDDRKHGLSDFYEVPAPLDGFVSSAIAGTGLFEGAADGVRAQGIEKGIQNQIMIAWVVHELNTAVSKAEEGNFDIAQGAVHNWDEGWAFYAGAEPGCGPYGTADKRGENFGTLTDDGRSVANAAILAAMVSGREALLASDVEGAQAAAADVIKNVVVTYSQAAIRYATLIEADVAESDADATSKHVAEGLAFWRVVEAYVTPAGADGETINAIFALDGTPGANGGGDAVRTALQPAWDALGITEADIGTLD
ncbi:MAG: hypothetical protein ACJAR2_001356 [Ilumatobacter sp.]|jgi:hypothetical protein